MQPQDYLRLARRYWRIIAVCIAVAVSVAWVTTPEPAAPGEPDRPVSSFEANHTLIRSSDSILGAGVGGTTSMKLLSLLATTGEVPLRVAEQLGAEDPAVLMSSVTATGDNELGTLRISATDASDGERAADLANTTADQLVAYLTETAQANQQQAFDENEVQLQELDDRIESLNDRIPAEGDPVLEAQRAALVRQYGAVFERREANLNQPPAGSGLITLERATPIPVFGSGPAFEGPESRAGRLAAGLAAGLAVGVGIAFVLFRFSTKIRSRVEAEDAFELPVLAEVPPLLKEEVRSRQIVMVTRPESGGAAAYRTIRTSIELMSSSVLSASFGAGEGGVVVAPTPSARARHNIVLVTSAGPGEGKTTTVANLAACFAEIGKVVAVVAADAHRPELVSMLIDRTTVADDTVRPPAPGLVRTRFDDVWLLPTSELVEPGGRRLARPGFLRELLGGVDIVLVDTPPLLLSTEAADLAPECDTVLLVAKSGRTRTSEAARATELLGRLRVPVLGVALLGADEALSHGDYRYYVPPPATDSSRPLAMTNGHEKNGTPTSGNVDAGSAAPAAQPPTFGGSSR